jgi:amidophosphoribosyltransferase
VFNNAEAANLTYLGLFALQHRGQEACGIVTIDHDEDQTSSKLISHKGFGHVTDVFNKDVLKNLPGRIAIGHVRYSTQGGNRVQNIQPFFFESTLGPIAVAHNGNLTNATDLRRKLEEQGSIFQSTSDSEIFMHLIAKSQKKDFKDKIIDAALQVKGAYSLVLLSEHHLFAVRDPFGFRPLVLGRSGETTVVASETCALDLIDAKFEREIQPGELVAISSHSCESVIFGKKSRPAFCSFEPIYFARPDSKIFGSEIYSLRKKIGEELAREAPANADVVIAVPDSGVPMAMGYANVAKLPMEIGLVRNHYIGRTFIQPSQSIRDFGVKLKLNPVISALKDKSIVVIDDSLVRGTTSAKIIRMLRQAGAREIHLRIGSPPITHSCFYGVDTPERKDLLAAQMNVDKIREFIGADSLAYLSVGGLRQALGNGSENKYCFACFNGNYLEDVFTQIPSQPTDNGGPGLVSQKNS